MDLIRHELASNLHILDLISLLLNLNLVIMDDSNDNVLESKVMCDIEKNIFLMF